jgi:hypothetical protein
VAGPGAAPPRAADPGGGPLLPGLRSLLLHQRGAAPVRGAVRAGQQRAEGRARPVAAAAHAGGCAPGRGAAQPGPAREVMFLFLLCCLITVEREIFTENGVLTGLRLNFGVKRLASNYTDLIFQELSCWSYIISFTYNNSLKGMPDQHMPQAAHLVGTGPTNALDR